MPGYDIIETIARAIPTKQHSKLRLAVLVSGNGSNLQALIDYSRLPGTSFEIGIVIANNPDSMAFARASQAHIDNHLVDHRSFAKRTLFEEKILYHLHEAKVDLVVLAGFLRVLSPHFLSRYPNRIINLHPSLLPKHPGLHAITNALEAKDEHAGCTVHLVDEGLDTGPIIAQSSCAINLGDDLVALTKKIQKLEHALLPSIVQEVAKRVLVIQDKKGSLPDNQNHLSDRK